MDRQIILASSSPRRVELLAKAGLSFIQDPSDIDEKAIAIADHEAFVREAALLKARDVAARHPADCIVLGADTIVCVDDLRLGKPADRAEARSMLLLLQNRAHQVMTGVALMDRSRKIERVECAITTVWFDSIPNESLESYLNTGEPYDKAGAYAIQGWAARFISRIEGDYDNVVGLPIRLVRKMLEDMK